MTRRCNTCRQDRPPEDFYRCTRDRIMGRQWQCKECNSARNGASYRRIRDGLLSLLGGRCVCCGETEPVFLQIDHVNGGGRAERKTHNNNIRTFDRRVRSDPQDFQLLCGNCHSAKTAGITCPHRTKAGTP